MLNSANFINRLKQLMDYHQFSASSFAEKVGVQRSSISHILSGRNKPSLDFILKINNVFEDLDLDWLLNGVGNYPKEKNQASAPILNKSSIQNSTKEIQRIVTFYTDGTFEEFIK
jgi:transcriptional regulator with XRE-family HTH domain